MLSLPNAHAPSRSRGAMPPPWSLYLWPTVFWQANRPQTCRFVHVGTRVMRGSPRDPLCGQTLWCESSPQPEAGLLWDWVEINEGIVAMADPMGVLTNLRLVSDEGAVMTSNEAALHLNGLIHQLPWQDEVWRSLRQA